LSGRLIELGAGAGRISRGAGVRARPGSARLRQDNLGSRNQTSRRGGLKIDNPVGTDGWEIPVSETTERTSASRPMFIGTLQLPSRSAPKLAPPEPPVRAPAPPPAPPGAKRITRRVADLAECRRRLPAVFDADHPLPLTIGIHKPLRELIGTKRANRMLEWLTSWPAYLAAVAAGGCRYNLDGSEAGQVTEEQRTAAAWPRDARAVGQSGGLSGTPTHKRR
jgi:ProQ/FINO family